MLPKPFPEAYLFLIAKWLIYFKQKFCHFFTIQKQLQSTGILNNKLFLLKHKGYLSTIDNSWGASHLTRLPPSIGISAHRGATGSCQACPTWLFPAPNHNWKILKGAPDGSWRNLDQDLDTGPEVSTEKGNTLLLQRSLRALVPVLLRPRLGYSSLYSVDTLKAFCCLSYVVLIFITFPKRPFMVQTLTWFLPLINIIKAHN